MVMKDFLLWFICRLNPDDFWLLLDDSLLGACIFEVKTAALDNGAGRMKC